MSKTVESFPQKMDKAMRFGNKARRKESLATFRLGVEKFVHDLLASIWVWASMKDRYGIHDGPPTLYTRVPPAAWNNITLATRWPLTDYDGHISQLRAQNVTEIDLAIDNYRSQLSRKVPARVGSIVCHQVDTVDVVGGRHFASHTKTGLIKWGVK